MRLLNIAPLKHLIKRIDDEKIYNFKAKSFSRILKDYKNQLLMY